MTVLHNKPLHSRPLSLPRQQALSNMVEELKTAALHLEWAHDYVYEAGTSAQPINQRWAQDIALLNAQVTRLIIRAGDQVAALRGRTQVAR